ncbi:hypothetical protein C0993_008675 [Termitomyces sp. T159_Od127]|nr:hypothetical protein C0993_008675 [Termitomyces sp. T159_Od127]
MASTLNTVPQEILEHIAFFSTNDTFLGPPSGLVPLLLTSRGIYACLHANHHLYARIYAAKFDAGPVARRIAPANTLSSVLAAELPHRFRILKQIRARLHCLLDDADARAMAHDPVFVAYAMMLENQGRNERQLRDYAGIDPWLRDYWFHDRGASRVAAHLSAESWLPETPHRSMAMWLFWFLMRPDDYSKDNQESWKALNILKIFALAAHKYELTNPAWHQFVPSPSAPTGACIAYLSEQRRLAPPPLATPAILAFLTLVNKLTEGVGYNAPTPPPPPLRQDEPEWEREWHRCVVLGERRFSNALTPAFRPGSIEGVWEGLFTVRHERRFTPRSMISLTRRRQYTEFMAYAALLGGGEPHVVQGSMVVQHRQTWKLFEHHLPASDPGSSSNPDSDHDSGVGLDCGRRCQRERERDCGRENETGNGNENENENENASDGAAPLPPGDPLRSHFPTGTQICETRDGIDVRLPGREGVLRYRRASALRGAAPVRDVVITGEVRGLP